MKRKQKRFVCGMTAAALLFMLSGCGEPSELKEASGAGDFSGQTLTVANWQSYGTDANYGAAQFEAMYGCKVEHYFISSVPELMQTLLNGGMNEIDVICINPVYIQEYYQNGVIEAIDTSELENYGDLRTDLTEIDDVKDPEERAWCALDLGNHISVLQCGRCQGGYHQLVGSMGRTVCR